MSYWIYANDENGETIEIERHNIKGGTYADGGTSEAELNLTYNYCKFYYDLIDKDKGIKWINDKLIKDTLDKLREAANKLKDNETNDYWESTEGNAKRALLNLIEIGTAAIKVDANAIWDIH